MGTHQSPNTRLLLGGIEGGGTKMVCAVGYADGTLVAKTSFPTGEPQQTVARMCAWFRQVTVEAGLPAISALGVATFGPIDVDAASPHYGRLLQTPKQGWGGFDLRAVLRQRLDVPVAFDTDVNGACLGELRYGSCRGLHTAAYVTVGTGIGVGVCIESRPLHGMLHPELGHLMPPRVSGDDFPGTCPAHGACLEGLASGPAVCARFGVKQASDLADDPVFLELESTYLAHALAACVLAYAPQRIVLGGGVPDHVPRLMPLVRRKLLEVLGGYIRTPELSHPDAYVVAPGCKGDQGVLGAIALAARLL